MSNLFQYTLIDAQRIHACTSLSTAQRIAPAIQKVYEQSLPEAAFTTGFILVGVKTQGYVIATCSNGWGLTQGHSARPHPTIRSNIKYSLQCVGRRSKTIALISAKLPPGQAISPITILFQNIWENMPVLMSYINQKRMEGELRYQPGAIVFDPFDL